jgi:hypothetical protein
MTYDIVLLPRYVMLEGHLRKNGCRGPGTGNTHVARHPNWQHYRSQLMVMDYYSSKTMTVLIMPLNVS